MQSTLSARLLLVSLVPIGFLALANAAEAQAFERRTEEALHDEEDPRIEEPRPFFSVVFEGIVLGPDGAPAAGAVVVTSAGGKAVTDQDGVYRLEIQAPLEAESVQVTAVASSTGGSLTASTSVGLLASRAPRVGPLFLTSSTTCQPSWLPTFGEAPGLSSDVLALTVFDDGSGPALYVGGYFTSAGSVAASTIARWDGSRWSAVGAGLTAISFNPVVRALTVFDDGSGPALYAGGDFTTAGGVAANNIARWNGSSWSALGGGVTGTTVVVRALSVFDDGSGPALYAGGDFTTAGGVAANNIARWNGSTWSSPGAGISGGNDSLNALTVFDDGSGSALYAGGNFTAAGGVAASSIARWNGSVWSALGSGLTGIVRALRVFDDGSGPALYAGGSSLFAAGGIAGIARWNGSSWSGLAGGVSGVAAVYALAVFDDGGGPVLYAGGDFTAAGGVSANNIARWNGSSWSALASGLQPAAYALTVFDDGSGPALHAGGSFTTGGGGTANRIAEWNGSSWSALGTGVSSDVQALTTFDDGSGPALYAGGFFHSAGGVVVDFIARWNGSGWSALGGMGGGQVFALAVFDDGGGPALYAGGRFTSAGGVAANRIAKWNGSSWSPLGSGLNSDVLALAVFDDGSGPALYAGGTFTTAGGGSARRIARWDGSSWSALGTGMGGLDGVHSLTVFDFGSGPALYAGGKFATAGGMTARNIARWNGSSWSAVGTGPVSEVHALTGFDDGSGPALYAGGWFSPFYIHRWNGSSWSAVGSGMNNQVESLTVFDDGGGAALYAGGRFTTAGGGAANRIARWDGSTWSALGSGMTGGSLPAVLALTVFDDGSDPALCAGGSFTSADDSGDSYIAEWGCDTTPPVLSCPTSVVAGDSFGGPPGEIVNFEVTATDVHDDEPDVVCVPPSGSFFPRGTTLVTCTATDDAGNVSTCDFPVTVQPKVHRPPKDPRGE